MPNPLLSTAVRMFAAAVLTCGIAVTTQVASARPAAADAVRNEQWQLKDLDMRAAWQLSTGRGIVVAVIDSGVDAAHPDLVGQVLPGADFVDGGDGRRDPVGHGTTVAALIAGRDDSQGVVGIAPHAKILPVRVLDKNNRYEDPQTVADGLRWAVDHGASIVNLSLGGAVRSDVLADALRYAAERDVVVIACTGNIDDDDASREVWYPAREPGVVAVAGLVGTDPATGPDTAGASGTKPGGTGGGRTDALWSGSLTGPETVLTAPAVNLVGAKPGGGYWRVQGTSFAAPLVAGTASLIRSRFPGSGAASVVNRLIRTARDLGPSGRDAEFGYGVVNPTTALRAEVADVVRNPLLAAPAGDASPSDEAAPAPTGAAPPAPSPASPGPNGDHALAGGARTASSTAEVGSSLGIGGLVAVVLFVAGVVTLVRLRTHRPRHRRD